LEKDKLYKTWYNIVNNESVSRIVFVTLVAIVCVLTEHFFVELDITRLLIILILFEHLKRETK